MPRPVQYPQGVAIYPPASRPMWRVQWRRPDGTQKSLWRTRREDAEALAMQVARQLEDVRSGARQAVTSALVDELLDWYLDPRSRAQPWSAAHERGQRSIVRTWVAPAIGGSGRACGSLSKLDMQAIIASARQQVGSHRVRAIGACLRRIVTVGREAGFLEHDPMLGVRYTPRSARQGQASFYVEPERRPTTEAVESLAAAASELVGWEDGLRVRLAAYSGLRWGEQHALTVGDVDVQAGRVAVERQVTYSSGRQEVKPPKYGKARETFVPAFLADQLGQLVELRAGQGVELLWPASAGGLEHHSNFVRKQFRPACEAAGWPTDPCTHGGRHDPCWRWSWHDLRHHAATWALATPPDGLGLEVADVSFFLGHSSTAFTMQQYVSTRPHAVSRAVRATRRFAG